MRKKSLESERGKRMFGLFLIFLAVVNLLIGLIYYLANPGKGLPVLVWGYFESSTFKIVNAGLAIPFLLFYVERRFKIMDTVRKNREDRKRKRAMERREKMWECVEKTAKMWDELFGLASETIYFKRDAGKEKNPSQASIEDLLRRIRDFESTAENIVNMWLFRFPNLYLGEVEKEVGRFESHSLAFVNVLLYATESVALHIREGGSTETEISNLQDSLRAIQDAIDGIAHHGILKILKRSINLEDIDIGLKEKRSIKSRTIEDLRLWKDWVDAFRRLEMECNGILPSIDVKSIPLEEGASVKAFRESCREMARLRREDPGKKPNEHEEFEKFRSTFLAIPSERIVSAATVVYSTEYVKTLARWLTFERMCYVTTRAPDPVHAKYFIPIDD